MKWDKILFVMLTMIPSSAQPQQANVCIYNEYNTLVEVVVGSANKLYFPESHEIETEQQAAGISKFLSKWVYPVFSGKRVPEWITRNYRNEQEALLSVLKQYGVVVHRPDNIDPLPDEPLGLGQMFARDPILSLGGVTINSQLQIPMRRKENRGFKAILEKLSTKGVEVKTLNEQDVFLEGGDVLVDAPYLFVGQSKHGSNAKGIAWLEERVGDQFEIVPVPITDPSVLHLDCVLTIIGEKRGIIHRKSLPAELPEPLRAYEFIDVDDKTAKELGTNVLVLNPSTIVVQKRHRKLIEQLKSWGYEVIPIKFDWHARLGGAFRCVTSPLVRTKDER